MKISCIVPVYNEGARVNGVLDVLVGHPLIDEIIVVNDGSKDNSEEILKNISGINLISYFPNMGKTHAVKTAFLAAKNEWIMMIDSDLVGLTKENISDLILPVSSGKFDVSMTLRQNSLSLYKFWGLDFVSGERVFRKEMIPDLSVFDKLPGFGLEVFLNGIIIEKNFKIAVVDWPNVVTPRKSVKYGFWTGVIGDVKMMFQIFKVMGFFGVIRQFKKMLSLRKVVREQDSL